jgi:hypothetical protein
MFALEHRMDVRRERPSQPFSCDGNDRHNPSRFSVAHGLLEQAGQVADLPLRESCGSRMTRTPSRT